MTESDSWHDADETIAVALADHAAGVADDAVLTSLAVGYARAVTARAEQSPPSVMAFVRLFFPPAV